MEYGLILGFNKYVIPFQREDHQLPFNVAGLDTVKYNNSSFRAKAEAAIDLAITQTTQKQQRPDINPDVGAYLLLHGWIVSPIEAPDDRAIYQLGAVCGFNLCNDFTGNRYMYFGNFATLRPPSIAWRIRKLAEIVDNRISGSDYRVEAGFISQAQKDLLLRLRKELEIWILASNEDDRKAVLDLINGCSITPQIFLPYHQRRERCRSIRNVLGCEKLRKREGSRMNRQSRTSSITSKRPPRRLSKPTDFGEAACCEILDIRTADLFN